MEGDRNLKLLVRAVATGRLDVADYDPQNKQQKLKLAWLLKEFEEETAAKIVDYRHRQQCALIASTKISGESWEAMQEQAINSFEQLRYFICPWGYEKPEASQQTNDESIVEAYERMWGKPGTPEHDALIEETNKVLRMTPAQQELHSLRRRMRDNVVR